MAAGDNTYKESDGKAVDVTLSHTVAKGKIVYVEGWLGIAQDDGESDDTIALAVDDQEYQITVPSSLAVAKGAILYIEVADLTGHYPDDAAYVTTAAAGKFAFAKATRAKDSNNVVTAIMLAKGQLLS